MYTWENDPSLGAIAAIDQIIEMVPSDFCGYTPVDNLPAPKIPVISLELICGYLIDTQSICFFHLSMLVCMSDID